MEVSPSQDTRYRDLMLAMTRACWPVRCRCVARYAVSRPASGAATGLTTACSGDVLAFWSSGVCRFDDAFGLAWFYFVFRTSR